MFSFLYNTVYRLIARKFNVEKETIEIPEGPCLILANHVTDLDPAFVADAVGGMQSYYICADSIMRKPLWKWLIMSVFEPIPHVKGKVGLSTVATIMKRIKEGDNISLFPEGNRSFDGRTAPLSSVIGKLAKKCKGNLVLVRIEGGYFSQPRWATTFRKGKISLKNGGVYTKEQLEAMSVEEITSAINKGLYADAYTEQEKKPQSYQGKHYCLGLESTIYKCPRCAKIGSLRTDDFKIFCECGYSEYLDEYGYLVDQQGNKHKISTYTDEQKKLLEKMVQEQSAQMLFEDDVKMLRVSEDYKVSEQEDVHIAAYADRVVAVVNKTGSFKDGKWQLSSEVEEITINRENIDALSIFSRNKITVYLKNDITGYEIFGGISFNALKYRDLYEIITSD